MHPEGSMEAPGHSLSDAPSLHPMTIPGLGTHKEGRKHTHTHTLSPKFLIKEQKM
jgi:hypothetical protein